MAIPKYYQLMLPFLKAIKDGQLYRIKDVVDKLASVLNITDEERKELLPSGQMGLFDNRVGWAGTYLKKAMIVESPQRGSYKITQRGKDVLNQNLPDITTKYLSQFAEFMIFLKPSSKSDVLIKDQMPKNEPENTPVELLENAYKTITDTLAGELIETIKSCPPEFFERLVIDLLLKMGYGGSRRDAGQVKGKVGDGGIDGIIKEDKLGLDVIYVQAKRWDGQVPASAVRDFLGALTIKKAKKGVFITTSTFPKNAHSDIAGLENKVVLIDGDMLAELMIEHNIGVSIQSVYEIKKIETDYFSED
ncbi:MAG: restriction endonuclease [Nitrospirae bacterium]|nr:restriction endonuclease [Nitrospirota bacterium]